MVWGLFPVDPLSGEYEYYISAKGLYKVGRKGCDIIITKDKGVSRIHAEISVDVMTSINPSQIKSSSSSCKVLVWDCSKYGTFINKNLGSMEKVHQFPNKETTLRDGDLISFGTGNATYRFSFVPLIFWDCCWETCQVNHPLQDKISSIGACIIHNFSQECTHVLVDEPMPLREDLLDAIVAKKPCILSSWVKSFAEENIRTEIPSCSNYSATLTVEGVAVKVTDPKTRENCFRGYTFVLDSTNKYKFGARLQSLLEVSGAKIQSIEGINLSSQAPDHEENNCIVCVIPGGSAEKFGCFSKLSSVSRVNEMDLISAVLSGQLDHSILRSPCVVVSSSCSTDETIVADSEAEVATVTLVHKTAAACSEELIETVSKIDRTTDHANTNNFTSFRPTSDCIPAKRDRADESENGNSDIIYSQDLFVQDTNVLPTTASTTNRKGLNFKRFRKKGTPSGNSFDNLIPFSKYPYQESDYRNEEIVESVKEEKKRKKMEAIAEDLFNNEKGRQRGTAGSLRALLSRC
nr:nijmegen breakage syndrome 1 protein-like isoform X1 [Ziziphus jujuba var. spinosa]